MSKSKTTLVAVDEVKDLALRLSKEVKDLKDSTPTQAYFQNMAVSSLFMAVDYLTALRNLDSTPKS